MFDLNYDWTQYKSATAQARVLMENFLPCVLARYESSEVK